MCVVDFRDYHHAHTKQRINAIFNGDNFPDAN